LLDLAGGAATSFPGAGGPIGPAVNFPSLFPIPSRALPNGPPPNFPAASVANLAIALTPPIAKSFALPRSPEKAPPRPFTGPASFRRFIPVTIVNNNKAPIAPLAT